MEKIAPGWNSYWMIGQKEICKVCMPYIYLMMLFVPSGIYIRANEIVQDHGYKCWETEYHSI